MATIARITTTSSAAAMMTAAVGLSPKIVVRSVVTVRGSAEPSSLLLSLFTAGLSLLVSVRELLLVDFSLVTAAPGPRGLAADELDELDGPEMVPLAEPDGVETEPLADPLGL